MEQKAAQLNLAAPPFLVPVLGDIARQDRELRRAMAQASLRENWRLVQENGGPLSDEEIEHEISATRGGGAQE